MRKSIGLSQKQYDFIENSFDIFPNGECMSYGELIIKALEEAREYKKIKDGVN